MFNGLSALSATARAAAHQVLERQLSCVLDPVGATPGIGFGQQARDVLLIALRSIEELTDVQPGNRCCGLAA